MPIVRTFQCEECFHRLELILTSEQWDDPPPECPVCSQRQMQQQFKPFAIAGSPSAKANTIAEDILANDYHVADVQRDKRVESTPSVRYKDAGTSSPGAWGSTNAAMEQAIASGRQMRLQHGSGLDVLQANIKNGVEPDLIANSKRRAIRVY